MADPVHFGRYRIERELGSGSMGVVYLALDPKIDRLVAVKILRNDRVQTEAFAKRFLKEAKVIGRLSHPGVVTIYDMGEEQGTIYIAMEFLEGLSLADVISVRRLDTAELLGLAIRIAETLDYAHRKGVVHRDIKPSNIIVTPDGGIKITDFGIARIEDATATLQTQAGEIMGTPAYMSPEQVVGHVVDGRSDLFSLGVILYEMTAGRRPFGGDGKTLLAIFNEIMQVTPAEPAALSASVPPALSALIMKALAKEPSDRFQTGAGMAEALKKCLPLLASPDSATIFMAPPAAVAPAGPPSAPPVPSPSRPVPAAASPPPSSAPIASTAAGAKAPASTAKSPGVEKKRSLAIPAAVAAVTLAIAAGGFYTLSRRAPEPPAKPTPSMAPARATATTPTVTAPAAPPESRSPTPGSTPAPPAPVAAPTPAPVPTATPFRPGPSSSPRTPNAGRGLRVPATAAKNVSSPSGSPNSDLKRVAVTILSTPPGARVSVDDVAKGATPLTTLISPGPHRVRVSLAGYRDEERQSTIEETMEYPISIRLKPAAEGGP